MSNNGNEGTHLKRRNFLIKTSLAAASVGAGAFASATPNLQEQNSNGSNAKKYQNKTVFITGGARGIGFATAKIFAEYGANVVIYDIASTKIRGVGYDVANDDDLKNATTEIQKYVSNCLAIKGDVRNKKALVEAMNKAVKSFGSIDFLIANAGVTQIGDIAEFNEEEVAAIIDINVSGVIKTVQAAVPIMRKQKFGKIVFISSGLGRRGHRDYSVYCASKWAVIGFAKSAAHALGKDNITCNTICPGLVDTKLANNKYLIERWLPNSPKWSSIEAIIKENNTLPIGPYKPADIAKFVELFCDPSMSSITGEVFDVSQGAAAEGLG